MIDFLKIIFLFIAIFFSLMNLMKIPYKQDIPVLHIFLQSIGITGFIYLKWIA